MTNDSNKGILSASEFITEVRILTRWEWLMANFSSWETQAGGLQQLRSHPGLHKLKANLGSKLRS